MAITKVDRFLRDYEEQIEIRFLDEYKYLFDIIDNYDTINDYRINGGRWAAKTTHIIIALTYLAANVKGFNVIGIRRQEIDVISGMKNDFIKFLNMMNISYEYIVKYERFTLPNGNIIELNGAVGQSGQPKMSGFSMPNDPKYIAIFADELYEFTKEEWDGVEEGVRGIQGTKIIKIRANNNWKSNHWYINQLKSLLPFNMKKLMEEGRQFRIVDKTLVHHTNILINPLALDVQVGKAAEQVVSDPERAKTSLYGYPGTLYGAVYSDNSIYYRDLIEQRIKYDEYIIGVSLLNNKKLIGISISGVYHIDDYGLECGYDVLELDEYSIEKSLIFKTEGERMEHILKVINDWIKKFKIKDAQSELKIRVGDGKDDTFYKKFAEQLNILGLNFDKYPAFNNMDGQVLFHTTKTLTKEEHMIDFINTAMSQEVFKIAKKAYEAIIQFDGAAYSYDKTKGARNIRDENSEEHFIIAIENSMKEHYGVKL